MDTRTTDQSDRAAEIAVELMRLCSSLGGEVQFEIDAQTGVSVIHDMGAFGACSDMPDDIARMYLADSIGALKENPSK